MRVSFREPATAGLILVLTMVGWEVQVGQTFVHDAWTVRGSSATQRSAVLENPEFVSFRKEKLGPGRSGGGMEDDLVMNDRPPRTIHRDEPSISIPTSPEVAEYILARQQSLPLPLPSQHGRLGGDTTTPNNNNNPTILLPPDDLRARQATQRLEIWDDSLRQVEASTQSAKDWMKAKLETLMDTQIPSPPLRTQTQQQSEDAMKTHNNNDNDNDSDNSEVLSPPPSALINDPSQNNKRVKRTDANGVPDNIDYETRVKYENWKRTREKIDAIQDIRPTPTTTTTTEARYTPPQSPLPAQDAAQTPQTRRIDPAQVKKNEQTIIVQAIRKDGTTNESTYSADFVSGRTTSSPSQALPIIISRPFFIESPEDFFFLDIGEAAMIKLAIYAQQSYYYPKNQGVAGVSATDGTGNWESGPYEYRASTPEIDQPKSWLGSLLSKPRVTREKRPSDRMTPINPKDEYTEFAVRRMPSGTISSRRRHERLLQRSAHRSPYGYTSYPRTKTRGISGRQGSDFFPPPLGNSPWMEPPPATYYSNYELTRPQSRRRVRQQRIRPTPPPPLPPPPYYPPRRYYD